MALSPLKILVLESDNQRAQRFADYFENGDDEDVVPLEFEVAGSLADGRSRFGEGVWNVVMTRLNLSDAQGLDPLIEFNMLKTEIPVIAVLGDEDAPVILDAAKSLADDCLFTHEMDRSSVRQSVENAIERKELLLALRERQSKSTTSASRTPFKALLDQLDDAVFLFDREGSELLYWNEVARTWFEGISEDVLAEFREYRVFDDERVELEIATGNSAIVDAELRSVWLEWKSRPACMVTLKSIGKRRRVEEAFMASQRRLELALKTSNIGMWSWDLQSRNPLFSERWKGQLGYESQEFSDTITAFREHLHPEDRERAFSVFRRFIRSPWHDFECEYRMRSRSGEYRHILCRAEMVTDEYDRSLRLIGTHIDITDRKRQEEAKALLDGQYRSARRGENLAQELDRWRQEVEASIISLRDSVLDLRSGANGSSNGGTDGFDAVLKEIDLLESKLPKADSKKADEIEEVDLGDLVLGVARDREMKLPQNCSFEIELGRHVRPVAISKANVSLLLSELLACSCEALSERSDARLTIRTGSRDLNLSDLSLMANGDSRSAGAYSFLEIEDNGTRFSLRAFKEALSGNHDEALSSALKLGFQSGASIDLARRAGERTSLRIYFPVTVEVSSNDTASSANKVLIAEDEIALHPAIKAVVEMFGLEPVLEADGCAAWGRFEKEPEAFALAILDVNLPGCGGEKLHDRLAQCRKDPVPTIFVSGDAEDALSAKTACQGPTLALAKPYRMADLKQAIIEMTQTVSLVGA